MGTERCRVGAANYDLAHCAGNQGDDALENNSTWQTIQHENELKEMREMAQAELDNNPSK